MPGSDEPLREPLVANDSTSAPGAPNDAGGPASGFDGEEFLRRFAPSANTATSDAVRLATEGALRAADESGRTTELAHWLIGRERAALEGPVAALESTATRLLRVTRQGGVADALDVVDAWCGAWALRAPARHLAAQRVGAVAAEFTRACAAMIAAAGVETLGEALDVVDGVLRARLSMFDRPYDQP